MACLRRADRRFCNARPVPPYPKVGSRKPLATVPQSRVNAPQEDRPRPSVSGGSMADDPSTQRKPNDAVIAVSDEALQKAEAFVEAEEGAANRLMGWPGRISTAIAVAMSLFHLYAAYAILPTQELRYT